MSLRRSSLSCICFSLATAQQAAGDALGLEVCGHLILAVLLAALPWRHLLGIELDSIDDDIVVIAL